MRHYFIIFLLQFAIMGISAQYGNSPANLETFVNRSGKFLMQLGDDGSIEGSRYLADDFIKGKIYLDSSWYEDTNLKFDIFNNCFEIKLEDDIYIIDPETNYADTVLFNDEIYIRKDLAAGPKINFAYMVLLTQNNDISLCKIYKMRLDPPKKSDGYMEASPASYVRDVSKYYGFNQDKNWEIKGLKSIAEMFGTDRKIIRSLIKEHNYKLTNEEDLAEIIHLLSE